MQVNILEAKTELSKLIRLIETGKEEQIIAKYGKPVAKMTVYNAPISKRIGIAKGKLKVSGDFGQDNEKVAWMFAENLSFLTQDSLIPCYNKKCIFLYRPFRWKGHRLWMN